MEDCFAFHAQRLKLRNFVTLYPSLWNRGITSVTGRGKKQEDWE